METAQQTEHLSDCSYHETGQCDCVGLDLATDKPDRFVPTYISSTGRFGFFINHMGRECFVEPEQLPTLTLAAIASATNLPDTHDAVAVLRGSNDMDFDDARKSIVVELQTLPGVQRLARS